MKFIDKDSFNSKKVLDLRASDEATTRTGPPAGTPDPLIDAAGVRHVPMPAADARIVSLVPSLTEMLFDLDLGPRVVGRTAWCVHPPAVKAVRSVGGTKTVKFDRVRALAPTHVVVNVDETPRAVADALAAEGWEVIVTHPLHPRDNLALFRLFGALFGREEQAALLARRFAAAETASAEAAATLPSRRVLYLIWKNPWMTVSPETYVSRMLAAAGMQTWPDPAASRYPAIELDASALEAVDSVLFASEPFPFQERHLVEFRETWPAHAGKARAIDGEMVSWYGSRAISGLRYLAEFARTFT